MRIFALIFSVLAGPVLAHEYWIEPITYQVAADGRLEGNLANGQEFSGTKLPYLPQRFVNFAVFAGDQWARVPGRPGDIPALNIDPLGEGLHVVAYQSINATVDYDTWEEFQTFVDHKDLGDVLSQHRARGLPDAGFTEIYARFSKTLIAVGDGAGADRRVGLETEIVALTNPYTDDLSDGMRVQVFYRDAVRADTQVEVFQKAADGSVDITLHRTDAEGIATIPVAPGFAYMLDAVVLKEPNAALAESSDAVWQTLWANMTFAIPE